ncbi:hypothetical protein [Bifidobacterium pseudolongum]|uniref:hypothetical protein n=1 Tax=Bifidobacterium pseudolongum TaxID=1694 RepID=UPI0013EDF269|nr:hypothetical protein [Bifidobacterium pseudolongum]
MTSQDIDFMDAATQDAIVKKWPRCGGNPSGRDWMIRVSRDNPNPDNTDERREMTPEAVMDCLEKASFFVFQLEEGSKTGYDHFQIFAQWESPTRLSSIRKAFNSRGWSVQYMAPRMYSVSSCLAYCSKSKTRIEGPWNKGEAQLPSTDAKTMLLEAENDLAEGSTTVDALLLNPETRSAARRHLTYLRAIEEASLRNRWSKTDRHVTTHLLWGPPRTGKTWSLTHERYDYNDVYRVTDWRNPWDSYQSQPVLILDEFEGQPDFHVLCQILEGYPMELPARYSNKFAAWREVWIVSNATLDELVDLYRQRGVSESMLPSLPGRISEIIHHTAPGAEESSTPLDFTEMQSRIHCQGASMASPLDPSQRPSDASQTDSES